MEPTKESINVRILVVDDDAVCLKAVELLLTDIYDCEVETVDSAEKALTNVYEIGLDLNPRWYDLILMDIKLPILKGSVVTKIIRETEEHLQNVPIIAITGSATEEDKQQYIKLGMNDVLIKPLTEGVMNEIMHKYLPGKDVVRIEG